jgi:2'-5' RNA ligase
MRLFIAINFNTDTRMQLLALRDELRIRSRRGSFTVPENLHLTLVFLGECDEAQTSSVKKVMSTINFEPFPIPGADC